MEMIIYTINTLLNTLRMIARECGVNVDALNIIIEQIRDQLDRLHCRIDVLTYERDSLHKQVKMLDALPRIEPVEYSGVINFHPDDDSVYTLAYKVKAVCAFRSFYGLGLKEAKLMVESGVCPCPRGPERWVVWSILTACGYCFQQADFTR